MGSDSSKEEKKEETPQETPAEGGGEEAAEYTSCSSVRQQLSREDFSRNVSPSTQ